MYTVHVPWYATLFRGDKFEDALGEIAPLALRYGAESFAVYRYREDRYKFLQVAAFSDHADWEKYWNGPEFQTFRARHSGWYQVPIFPTPADCSAYGTRDSEPVLHDGA